MSSEPAAVADSDAGTFRLSAYRRARDAFFARHPHSPLSPRQRESFTGLSYFPPHAGLVFSARLEPASEVAQVSIATSRGNSQSLKPGASVRLRVGEEELHLTLYPSAENGFFLPFRDGTSGRLTYGGGRYLDVAAEHGGMVVIDFNYAYNPYCAYNARWECPVPPSHNVTKLDLEAGEMKIPERLT